MYPMFYSFFSRKWIYIFIFTAAVNSNISAQKYDTRIAHSSSNQTTTERFVFPQIQNYDGTYQFVFESPQNIQIHKQILRLIEGKRDKHKDVQIRIAPFCVLHILSEDKIKSKDFSPFSVPYLIK